MPPRPSVPNVVQVVIKGNLGAAHAWVNKLFVSYVGGPPTALDLITYAGNISDAWQANLTPLQHIASAFTEVEVTDLSSDMGNVGTSSSDTPGTRTGGLLPGSTACLLSWRIGRHYRGGHPRTYLAVGTDTDLLTQATWLAIFTTAVSTAVGVLQDTMLSTAGGFAPAEHVNVSYFGGLPPVGGHSVHRVVPVVDVITAGAFTVSPNLASQRRRIGRK